MTGVGFVRGGSGEDGLGAHGGRSRKWMGASNGCRKEETRFSGPPDGLTLKDDGRKRSDTGRG